MNQLPTIAGVEITQDSAGRYNLNALHRASGLPDHKAPNQWLRSKQAEELIAAFAEHTANLQSGDDAGNISVVNGGASPGTFAHELIAISYAGWIKPSFQLQVNQVFIDYRKGRLSAPVPEPVTAAIDLAPLDNIAKCLRLLSGNSTELKRKSFDTVQALIFTAFPSAGVAYLHSMERDQALVSRVGPTQMPLDLVASGPVTLDGALDTAAIAAHFAVPAPAKPRAKAKAKAKPALLKLALTPRGPMGHHGLGSAIGTIQSLGDSVVGGYPRLLDAMTQRGLISNTGRATAKGSEFIKFGKTWQLGPLLQACGVKL